LVLKKTIILLSGKKRVGKDTVADHLISTYGYVKIGFADALKHYLRAVLDINIDNHVGRDLTTHERFALQHFGTDCCRKIDPDVWVRHVINTLKDYNSSEELPHWHQIVIKDTRFPNEVTGVTEWGEANGYKVITIRLEYLDKPIDDGHESEVGLDDWEFDYTLYRSKDTTEDMTLEAIDRIIADSV
jgi:hypothetical protein